MAFFSIKKWDEFQHYRDRNPPWIRFYNTVLDDYDIASLQDASKAHLFAIWLLASRLNNRVPYDAKWVAQKINATTTVNLEALEKLGFIEVERDASTPIAKCSPETEAETDISLREAPSKSKRKTAAHRLPDDWKPTLEDVDYARKQNLTPAETSGIIKQFKRYFHGPDCKRPLKSDWHRAWCNWIDNDAPRIIARRAKPVSGRQKPDSILEQFAEIAGRMENPVSGERDAVFRDGQGFNSPQFDPGEDQSGVVIDGEIISPAAVEQDHGIACQASADDEIAARGFNGPQGDGNDLRGKADELSSGRGSRGSDDTGGQVRVLARMERVEGTAGNTNRTAQQNPDYAPELETPDFLKRTA